MKQNKATWTRIPIALAIGMMAVILKPGAGGSGYLARVGPAPLRFQSATPTKLQSGLPPLPAEDHRVAQTNSPPSLASTAMTATNSSFQPFADISLWPATPQVASTNSSPPDNDARQPGGEAFRPSSSDAPVLTPQTFLEFFKPAAPEQNGANSGGVSVIAPLNFIFPTPQALPSSRAVYRSE